MVDQPATDGRGRSAGISVSVLTMYRHKDTWRLLVRKRSKTGVAVDSDLVHVLPSFMLAPEHGAYDDEFSVIHNIRREFAEELFRLKAPRDAEYIWFESTSQVRDLDAMLGDGRAELWITGIAVSLLSLRPEICALLWIKDPQWYQRSVAYDSHPLLVNEEFASQAELERSSGTANVGKNVQFAPSDTDETIRDRAFMTPSQSVPVGAAAFWLGVDWLRALMTSSPPDE